MKYIVTGAEGFVGKAIIKYLKSKKIDVVGISKKNNKKNTFKHNLEKPFPKNFLNKNVKIDTVIHTAAYHKLDDFKLLPKVKSEKNQKMVKNLLQLCKKNKIKKIIFFSTIDISYGDINNKKKKFYNISKLKSETYLKKRFQNGLLKKLIILRLPAIIGKNCNKNFLSNLSRDLKENKKVKIWRHNQPYNNLIHINDICKLIFYLLTKNFNSIKIFNCLASKPISLTTVFSIFKRKLKSKSKSEIVLTKKNFHKKVTRGTFFKFMTVSKSLDLYLRDTL